jgi:SAM-dependent methyltransferase
MLGFGRVKVLGATPGQGTQLRCPGCNGPSIVVFSEHGDTDPPDLAFGLCKQCGLVFLATKVSEEQLKSAYAAVDSDAYYAAIDSTLGEKSSRAVADLSAIVDRDGFSLLDVGCGYGHFLRATRSHWPGARVVGHEFDDASAEACRAASFQVTTGDLAAVDELFDVITLLDVAEHVDDPVQVFTTVRRLLRPGGLMYVHTPCRCGWDSLFLVLLHCPGIRRISQTWLRSRLSIFHLRLWSDVALTRALNVSGFDVESFSREFELSWPIDLYAQNYLGRRLHFPAFAVRVSGGLARFVFVDLRLLRNKAIVVARPRPSLNGSREVAR